jgi:hypothetical protein
MLAIETTVSVYAPPTSGLPFLSVIIKPGRAEDPLVTAFPTAVEAEAFNLEVKAELSNKARLAHGHHRHAPVATVTVVEAPLCSGVSSKAIRHKPDSTVFGGGLR